MFENYRLAELRRAEKRRKVMDEEIIPRLRVAGFGAMPLHEIDARGRMRLHMLARIPQAEDESDTIIVVPVFLKGLPELDLVVRERRKPRSTAISYYTDGRAFFFDTDDQQDIFPLIDHDEMRYGDTFARHLLGADPDDIAGSHDHPLARIERALGSSGLVARSNAQTTIERQGVVWGHPQASEVAEVLQRALEGRYAHIDGRIVEAGAEPRWVVTCDDTSTIRLTVAGWAGRSTAAQPLSVSFGMDRRDQALAYMTALASRLEGSRTVETDANAHRVDVTKHDGWADNVIWQVTALPDLVRNLKSNVTNDLSDRVGRFAMTHGTDTSDLENWVDDWRDLSNRLKAELGRIASDDRKIARWRLRTNVTVAALDVLAEMEDGDTEVVDLVEPARDDEGTKDESPAGFFRKVEIRRVHRLAVVLDGDVDDILTAVTEWSTDRPVRVGLTILDHVQEGRTWPRVRLEFETAVTSLAWHDLKAQVLNFVSGLAVVEGTTGFALRWGDHVEVYERATADEGEGSLAGAVLPLEVL